MQSEFLMKERFPASPENPSGADALLIDREKKTIRSSNNQGALLWFHKLENVLLPSDLMVLNARVSKYCDTSSSPPAKVFLWNGLATVSTFCLGYPKSVTLVAVLSWKPS